MPKCKFILKNSSLKCCLSIIFGQTFGAAVKTVDKVFLTRIQKREDSSTSTSETDENVYLYVLISSFRICIYIQYMQKISTKVNKSKIKSS